MFGRKWPELELELGWRFGPGRNRISAKMIRTQSSCAKNELKTTNSKHKETKSSQCLSKNQLIRGDLGLFHFKECKIMYFSCCRFPCYKRHIWTLEQQWQITNVRIDLKIWLAKNEWILLVIVIRRIFSYSSLTRVCTGAIRFTMYVFYSFPLCPIYPIYKGDLNNRLIRFSGHGHVRYSVRENLLEKFTKY